MSELITEGRLKFIGETVAVGTNGFEKREFSITTDEQYPQTIMFELQQGKVVDLDGFRVGEKIKVHFNLRGREWVNPQGETKVFNTLVAWRLIHSEPVQQQAPQTQHAPAPAPQAPPQAPLPNTYQPPKKSAIQVEAERIGYQHTNTQFTLDSMAANGWTFDALVAGGYGKMAEDLPF